MSDTPNINILCSQVKSDIDSINLRFCQIFASITFSGVLWRVLLGPIPYLGVAGLVGIIKMVISFILALLNISHMLQFLMINNISTVNQFRDRTIQAAAVCVGGIACVPGLVVTVMVRIILAF